MVCVMINMDIEGNYTCHPHSGLPSKYQAASIVRQLVESQIYGNVGTVMKTGGSGGGGAAEAGFPYSTIEVMCPSSHANYVLLAMYIALLLLTNVYTYVGG